MRKISLIFILYFSLISCDEKIKATRYVVNLSNGEQTVIFTQDSLYEVGDSVWVAAGNYFTPAVNVKITQDSAAERKYRTKYVNSFNHACWYGRITSKKK